MSTTLINLSISLDGFIAAKNESRDLPLGEDGAVLHHWMLEGDTALTDHIDPLYNGFFNASGSNVKVITDLFGEIGAMVFGRRTYDLVQGWGGTYPVRGIPVYVVTRHPPETPAQGRSEIVFVSTVSEAIERARSAANGKSVGIAGGRVGMSCLTADLVDEIYLHVVPVILGGGVRLFDPEPVSEALHLEHKSVVEGPGVTHIRYYVHPRVRP